MSTAIAIRKPGREATLDAALREVQSRNGQTRWPRGKWFNKRVCGLAAECGIELPSKRKKRRLAAAIAEAPR